MKILLADTLDALAQKTAVSLLKPSRNEYGYLLDFVDGNMMDWSVRPNRFYGCL